MPLQISDKVLALAAQAQAELAEQFGRIDAIAEENTRKVLAAFQKHRVAEAHFAGTTGYGYDDLGRDTLDQIYARSWPGRAWRTPWCGCSSSTVPTPSPAPCSGR